MSRMQNALYFLLNFTAGTLFSHRLDIPSDQAPKVAALIRRNLFFRNLAICTIPPT